MKSPNQQVPETMPSKIEMEVTQEGYSFLCFLETELKLKFPSHVKNALQ